MVELVLATSNKNKIAELRELLSEKVDFSFRLLSLADIGITEDIPEDGTTFEENAVIKASAAARRGYIALADDSGLSVNALGGAPGIFSARYAGEEHDYEKNNEKLLSEMAGVSDRSASFVCVMALVIPKAKDIVIPTELADRGDLDALADVRSSRDVDVFTVRGEVTGEILEKRTGHSGFGYDPLFFVPDAKKSFAEMTPDEKNQNSHRGRAVEKMAKLLNAVFAG